MGMRFAETGKPFENELRQKVHCMLPDRTPDGLSAGARHGHPRMAQAKPAQLAKYTCICSACFCLPTLKVPADGAYIEVQHGVQMCLLLALCAGAALRALMIRNFYVTLRTSG